RQMVLRQPITRVWGHQERLLTIARQEVHSHALKCLKLFCSDGLTGLCDTHRPKRSRGGTPVARSLSSESRQRRLPSDHQCVGRLSQQYAPLQLARGRVDLEVGRGRVGIAKAPLKR